jgi:hypothetical protein
VNFKISFYVNSHTNKLFKKQKKVSYFIIICVIIQMDDRHGITVKGNNNSGWSSGDVML